MKSPFILIAGVCAFLAPALGLFAVFTSVFLAPWFSWMGNALSDLGVGETALLFNTGLVAAGILAGVCAFALGLLLYTSWIGRIGSLSFLSACVALVLIGIFPESAGRIHFWASIAFFASLPISMLILGGTMFLSRGKADRWHGLLTVILAVAASLAWSLPHDGVAIPEIISSVAGSIWLVVLGFRILLKAY